MKHLSLIAFFMSIFFSICAQETIVNNKFIVGGSVNFLSQANTNPLNINGFNQVGGIFFYDTNDTKNTSFSISPYFGKELSEHWTLGLQLDYRYGNYTAFDIYFFNSNQEVKDLNRISNQFGVTIFSRYMLNPSHKLNFYIQPYLRYNTSNNTQRLDNDINFEQLTSSIRAGAGLGALYHLNNRWRLTLRNGGLYYENGKWEIKDIEQTENFSSFRMDLNLSNTFFGLEMTF